jgi:hypothetical protein
MEQATTYFRAYVQPGCPHCEAAVKYFINKGRLIEVIVIDPLIAMGIPLALKRDKLETPLVFSFLDRKLIIGYKPEEYDECIAFVDAHTSQRTASENTDAVETATTP